MTNIKIVKLVTGDDIVCAFPSDQLPKDNALLRITKPFQINYIPQLTPQGFKDYVALVKWTAYTRDQVITIPKEKIMTITNATGEMQSSYVNIIRDYNVVDKVPDRLKVPNYEQERVSDEDDRRLNEIFDEFEEDPTVH